MPNAWLDTDGAVFTRLGGEVHIGSKLPEAPPILGIAGYYDGMIQGCPTCYPSGNPAWDGTFPTHDWAAWYGILYSTWSNKTDNLSIAGKVFTAGTYQGVKHFRDPERFMLTIHCAETEWGGYPVIMWQGMKYTGLTGVGTYIRTGGCSNVESLDIVEV